MSKVILLFIVSLVLFFPLPPLWSADKISADTSSAEIDSQENPIDFYLIPLLETAFSGNLRWRPDWPADIPPDGFYLQRGSELPMEIELFNDVDKFTVKWDSEGRLVEFPFFLENGYVRVKAAYNGAGALQTMTAAFSSGDAVKTEAGQTEEKAWNVEFPAGFFPYSELSPGGTFPPAMAGGGDKVFYVFFFESAAFLTETWYDSEGNFLSFCKALVDHEGKAGPPAGGRREGIVSGQTFDPGADHAWRIRSLQIHDAESPRFEDYFFDSNGDVTEVRFSDKVFQVVYQNGLPRYWKHNDGIQFDLHWDTQGILTGVKTAEGTPEYRYEYKRDISGNWVSRMETALGIRSDLLVPTPSLSRGTWNRRIQFFEAGIGKAPPAEN